MDKVYRKVGAYYSKGKSEFCVWAPAADKVLLEISSPDPASLEMHQKEFGYWYLESSTIKPGAKYKFRLDDQEPLPDPASFSQEDGVHSASELIDSEGFSWDEGNWKVPDFSDFIIYELHVGTFSAKGNFKGIIEKLPYLKELGINAIELLPLSEFPGSRNWGYDGVYPFAVHKAYGGAYGLNELVNECHRNDMAVILDLVYNHLGPEGNYLGRYAPYFSDRYNTPWGEAVNFDAAWSYGVRNYVVNNMLHWFRDFRIDALRLDAVHAIYDFSAQHIMEELSRKKLELSSETGRQYYLIAESDLNDTRYIKPYEKGGYGMDAQWSDDFHHAVHALVTKENGGYYKDFGNLHHLAKTYANAFYYDGLFSEYRKKVFGNSTTENPAYQFVVCSQNHDQVGNRKNGDRLSRLINYELLKTVAVCVITSPYVPMLFMGEEYAEDHPFLYFVSHTDPMLNKLVREGRQKEFRSFYTESTDVPDPSDPATFYNSRLSWDLSDGKKAAMHKFYRRLIEIRKTQTALKNPDKNNLSVQIDNEVLIVERYHKDDSVLIIMNFSPDESIILPENIRSKNYRVLVNSSSKEWQGPVPEFKNEFKQGEQISLKPHSSIILSNY